MAKPGQQTGDAVGTARDRSLIIVGQKGKNLIRKITSWITRLGWIPLAVSFCAYHWGGGLGAGYSLYAAIALYFVNPIVDYQDGFVLFAEISSVVVTTSVIITIIQSAIENLNDFILSKSSASTAVFTDNEWGEIYSDALEKGYVAEPEKSWNFKNARASAAFLYSEDTKNIGMYRENQEKLAGRDVYLMLNHADPFLLKSTESARVHFFNLYEIMARKYWKDHSLYEEIRPDENGVFHPFRIAVLGFGDVGRAIFKYGYLNNIYETDQRLEYHLWGCGNIAERRFLSSLQTMNKDSITVHTESWEEDISEIAGADRIIITGEDGETIRILQELLYENPNAVIHCACGGDMVYEEIFLGENVATFGNMKEILTEDYIKREQLLLQAKLFNYDYALSAEGQHVTDPSAVTENMENEWDKLNGFFRGSNVARADHYWIEKWKLLDGHSIEEEQRIEHMRWCRYYFYNHWTYGGKKDKRLRLHPDLVPYDELPKKEQDKDDFYDPTIRDMVDAMLPKKKS